MVHLNISWQKKYMSNNPKNPFFKSMEKFFWFKHLGPTK
uniref:Uncharacterized protein n=1 Tax=Rhizophora mucronata TaxID=61149 RepID=A0A2P2PSR1_RHIMU